MRRTPDVSNLGRLNRPVRAERGDKAEADRVGPKLGWLLGSRLRGEGRTGRCQRHHHYEIRDPPHVRLREPSRALFATSKPSGQRRTSAPVKRTPAITERLARRHTTKSGRLTSTTAAI